MPRKDGILKIRLSDDLKGEVERVADAQGETVAVIVRQALREFIDGHYRDAAARSEARGEARGEHRGSDPPPDSARSLRLNEPDFTDAGTAPSGQPSPGGKQSGGV